MTPPIVERLPNGFTTAVCEVPGRHQVLITLFVRVGARFEAPAQSGISHFVEHLLFRGSEAYPDAYSLNTAFEQVGGMPNAMTGVEATEIYFVVHPQRVGAALAVLADMVCRPRLVELEKERGIIQDEILYDYNDKGELIHLGALVARMLWPHHGLGQQVTGAPETLSGIDDAAARAHHARYYAPQNMVLGICGGLSAGEGLAAARASFGAWNAGNGGEARAAESGDSTAGGGKNSVAPPAPPAGACPGPQTRLVHDADNQFHLQLSFPAPGYNAPQEIPLVLLTRVLDDGPNTRLQRRIREELALAYHVGAEYTGFADAGQLDITTSVKAGRLGALLDAMVECLVRFREDGPTEKELTAAKRRYELDLQFSRDSLDAHIERHVWPLLYAKPRTIEQELETVRRTSPAELHGLAREVLSPARLQLAMVGPVDDTAREIVGRAVGRFKDAARDTA